MSYDRSSIGLMPDHARRRGPAGTCGTGGDETLLRSPGAPEKKIGPFWPGCFPDRVGRVFIKRHDDSAGRVARLLDRGCFNSA